MKMNFGSGPTLAPGWVNVDREAYHASSDEFFHFDIMNGLPWGDVFDGIVANHSLQCLAGHELDPAVAELHRVLRPGGRLRVLVPDVFGAIQAADYGEDDWPGFVAISEPWGADRKLCHYITWGGQNRTVFSSDTLADLLARNGFTGNVPEGDPWPWLCELDSRLGESIIMEFGKP